MRSPAASPRAPDAPTPVTPERPPTAGTLDPAADAVLRELLPLLAGHAQPVWIVGGAVRDLALSRPLKDVDLAVAGEAKPLARRVHDALGGDLFSLSDRFGTWRVQPAGRPWRLDVSPLRGSTIHQDLGKRDFTAGAMALPVTAPYELVDPHDGIADIASATLRVLGEQAYRDDPLRPLRLPRLAAQLDFTPDVETVQLTRRHAASVTDAAAERIFAELRDLVSGPHPLHGLAMMGDLGLTAAVMPELLDLEGVEQSVYHHKDVYGHTFEVLEHMIEIEHDLAAVFGEHATGVAQQLALPLADELTRGQALRWSALLHDIAKPHTRMTRPNGRVGFPGHDEVGAEMVHTICRRLHTSEKFAAYVAALTRHHLRLGFLVDEPLDRRREYAYLTACEPVEVEVGVLSVADRLATRGRKADLAIPPHIALARTMAGVALEWRAGRGAEPLVRGDVLAEALGVAPGPRLGELLAAIDEARYVGEVSTPEQAVELARKML